MHTFLRIKLLLYVLLFIGIICPFTVNGQCIGLPTVTSLGSNKLPVGICAPVNANVTYSISFVAPVPAGALELLYDWGDGTTPEVLSLASGGKSYNASRLHTFPAESDCEYYVTIGIRYKGQMCTSTTQVQKISSWRSDAFNGGKVSLISQATKTEEHLVCEGEDIAVMFEDNTNWNCNSGYQQPGADPIESPNIEHRWQQLVYNTPVTGSKIPNVSVDGVAVTGPYGLNVKIDYEDPRGVHYMSAPWLSMIQGDDHRWRSPLPAVLEMVFQSRVMSLPLLCVTGTSAILMMIPTSPDRQRMC